MSRNLRIPLFLWICAALCVHFMLGSGGWVVGAIHDDRSELRGLAVEARERTAQEERTFEVALLDTASPELQQQPRQKPENDVPLVPPGKQKDQATKDLVKPVTPVVKPKREETKPEEKKKLEEEQKRRLDEEKKKREEEKKKLELLVKQQPQPKEPPKVLPPDDHRIAVRQHTKPDQKDNPTANFIADKANHVDKEEVATQTSNDRDDEKPTPGATHNGPDLAPGDSDNKTHIADSEDHKGERHMAPGERGTDSHVQDEPMIPKLTFSAPVAPTPTPAPSRAGDAHDRGIAQAAAPEAPPSPGGPVAPASPDVQSAPTGGWSFNPAQPNAGGSPSQNAGAGRAHPMVGGDLYQLPGLGRHNEGGSGINTNLTQAAVASLVGVDELHRLREADGERRKSEHRGSFKSSSFEHWRSAIENYVSSVKPGNQTALNTAHSPFASYIAAMHNRIHPIFTENFLEGLDSLGRGSPLNDMTLMTRLEIILSTDGHLKGMGVVHSSGITMFDIAALDSVSRASPFGPPPEAIVSGDGNVYLHWDFHRNDLACGTAGARPYLLPGPSKGPPAPAPGPGPGPNTPKHEEPGLPPSNSTETRQGVLEPLRPPLAG